MQKNMHYLPVKWSPTLVQLGDSTWWVSGVCVTVGAGAVLGPSAQRQSWGRVPGLERGMERRRGDSAGPRLCLSLDLPQAVTD